MHVLRRLRAVQHELRGQGGNDLAGAERVRVHGGVDGLRATAGDPEGEYSRAGGEDGGDPALCARHDAS